MRFRTGLAALATVLAACASGSDLPTASETTTPATATTTTGNETTTMSTSEQHQLPIVTPARADLARRLGVDPDDLEVISAEEVTWPDGSLGCPEPGMSYTQALVDGSKVVLGTTTGFTCITPVTTTNLSSAPPKRRTAATRWSLLPDSTSKQWRGVSRRPSTLIAEQS